MKNHKFMKYFLTKFHIRNLESGATGRPSHEPPADSGKPPVRFSIRGHSESAGKFLLLLALGCLAATPLAAQHAHIYAGATNQATGTPLYFQNANVWDTNSYGGYAQAPACIYFEDNYPEFYPGLFQTAATFSSLPATIFKGGPSPFAAALGTYIEMKFVSLQGPPGGALTVWNEVENPEQPTLMFTVPVGAMGGTNRINLSESDPLDATADPYGHIHDRRLTVNKPGLYILGLQLVDTSHHGPGGAARHSSSAVTYFYLQAGLQLGSFSRSNHVTQARFGLPGFENFVFEASPALPATNWTTIATITGTSHSELRWVRDTNATGMSRFYRVRRGTNSALPEGVRTKSAQTEAME